MADWGRRAVAVVAGRIAAVAGIAQLLFDLNKMEYYLLFENDFFPFYFYTFLNQVFIFIIFYQFFFTFFHFYLFFDLNFFLIKFFFIYFLI